MSASLQTLAINGGAPVLSTPCPSLPLRWGQAEKDRVVAALDQSSLFYWNGPQTNELNRAFRQRYPLEHLMPCSSGTAAIHIAVAAAGIAPGDEVIVPPITDMGTVIGILYQQAVPVFADLHPHTVNLDPVDVRRRITSKTRAIILVHLAGNPTPIEPFKALAKEFNLVLIEDCAQAWGARWQGKPVGTLGDVGCYSLNDFKHIGCGDGGIVGSNDLKIGNLLQLFGDKGYSRTEGTRMPEILAPNYRITEEQSAIAREQLERLEAVTSRRHELGERFNQQLAGVSGIELHEVPQGGHCTWWFQLPRLAAGRDRTRFVAAVQAEGASISPGYIAAPLYRYPVFQQHSFFAGGWPVKSMGLTDMDYREVCCPVAEEILNTCMQVPIHQGMDEAWIDGVTSAIRKVSAALI